MSFVKKINVNYTDCDSGLKFELPALMTEQGLIISHMRYLAWFSSKSESWKERSTFALRLLIEYIHAVPNSDYEKATQLLKSFTETVLTGTIDYTKLDDPLDLFWKPRKIRDVNNILFHITHYTDFLALQDGYTSSRINPFRKATSYEERLNWCAYYHKQQNVFLNHLTKRDKAKSQLQQVRLIGKFIDSKIENEKVIRFPEEQIERLIYLGFNKNGIIDFKSQAITMLLNYGGIRKSEVFHIYLSDITLNPNRPGEAFVRVYHPEYGKSPDGHYKTRSEYLLSQTHYKPRNKYRLSERLYSGWKNPLLTSRDGYYEVVFSPPHKAKEFLAVWVNYLKFQRVEPDTSYFHPFAFTNSDGKPETIKNYQRLHKRAVERIGLECKKELGT
ncbi:gamma-mobile-trio recombinase GmtY [Rheinheimera salexigens]|uniref:gamma-mobile-trio recombinase GmtY n=1 Tax=Rheinheimera salexigens TaxID=1628148 RepID=UPI000B138E1E|nr:gamma-mobile-trio recombinase GmtY [Rheinheimera salexigens]